ncbi:MAG: ABC transporter transmembrane domain-containing protein [Kiloniellales bacterium]
MEPSIFKFILRHSMRQQVILTILAAVSFPFLYAFYELPKRIVNEVIQVRPDDFQFEVLGVSLDQITVLGLLCGLFLALVIINQAFKYVINVYRGLTGERMLRRFRYQVYARMLRFPQPTFKKMSSGEIIQMITAETEPLGGFIGEAFSLPAFQGGTLLVILAFLLIQNWVMALAAVALYPLQMYVIPKLQWKVNQLAKERVRLVRRLSDRIGETVAGVQEIHAHDAARFELANFSNWLGTIFAVRYKIYLWKFVIKFLNNFINQLGPLFFYSIGGYFVIVGELQIGTLIAAIAAHKDLAAPWKELLAYYQRREDARIKYDTVVEQFAPADMLDERLQLEEPEVIEPLTGEIVAGNVGVAEAGDISVLENVSFSIPVDKHVAVVGGGGSGKEELGQVMARLLLPTSGKVTLGGRDIVELPEAITGRRIAYAGQAVSLTSASLRDNLFYGLKHRPAQAPNYDRETAKARETDMREARLAGNIDADVNADWIDYQAAGADGQAELNERAMQVLQLVDMDGDVYQMGLRGIIDPAQRPEVAQKILAARERLRERLADPEMASLVELFDQDKYNQNATVGENLLFGTPVNDAFDVERLAENTYVREILDQVRLTGEFLEIGRKVAETMVELFADVPPDHPFFEQFSFISSDDLPDFQALLNRCRKDGLDSLGKEDRDSLLSLPFKLIPARHRLGLIDERMRGRIQEARRAFAESLPEELKGAIEFFDAGRYNAASTLIDNILFGKVVYGQAAAADRVGELIHEVVDDLQLRGTVVEVGLDFGVGIGGSRLSVPQRQKLALARCLLKRPDLLIVNQATAPLDSAAQGPVMDNVLEYMKGKGVIWILHRASAATRFEHVIVLQNGRIVEQDTFEALNREGTALQALMQAD